jgi:hypothetical protein
MIFSVSTIPVETVLLAGYSPGKAISDSSVFQSFTFPIILL